MSGRLIATTGAVIAFACHRQSVPPPSSDGTYEFTHATAVRGVFTIRDDAIVFNLTTGYCPPAMNPRGPDIGPSRIATYVCTIDNGAHYYTFKVSLDNPLRRSTWEWMNTSRGTLDVRRVEGS